MQNILCFASSQLVRGFDYILTCLSRQNEMVIIIVGVFSLFSLSRRLLLYRMHLQSNY